MASSSATTTRPRVPGYDAAEGTAPDVVTAARSVTTPVAQWARGGYAWFVHERVKPSRRRGFTRLSSKRQVTLPLAVVQQLGLAPGDELRVDADDDRIVLRRSDSLADRRLRALEQVAGSLADVYEPGYLDRLRDEWR